MASEKLPVQLIGLYQDAFMRVAGNEGSVESSQVSSIMKSVGLNPSEAEIQVAIMIVLLLSVILLRLQDMVNQVDKDGTGSAALTSLSF